MNNEQMSLEFAEDNSTTGFRLERLELLNWGTFDKKIWSLFPTGKNILVTGEIGSGKSTIADAITTLLVPPQWLSFNKAAGAEKKERDLKSYVLGYYKTESSDNGLSGKPVSLRDTNSYSVILGVFKNSGYNQIYTLAQVFMPKIEGGQPDRFYFIASSDLSIKNDFSGFGNEIKALKARLRKISNSKIYDSFKEYANDFKRYFGIDNDQALGLFNQTISMKSVGNLTTFIRENMLQEYEINESIESMIQNYEQLSKAHDEILKAKDQIELLKNIAITGQECAKSENEITNTDKKIQALPSYFLIKKVSFINNEINNLNNDNENLLQELNKFKEDETNYNNDISDITSSIALNGGNEITEIENKIKIKNEELIKKKKNEQEYKDIISTANLLLPQDIASFEENKRQIEAIRKKTRSEHETIQEKKYEKKHDKEQLTAKKKEIDDEINSLKSRINNIPLEQINIRRLICVKTNLLDDDLPFVGELLQVKESEKKWQGAIERVLHGFGLSLLVSDKDYPNVSKAVDETNLKGKVVYFRVKGLEKRNYDNEIKTNSMVRKIKVKPDCWANDWLQNELEERFNYICCENIELFQKEKYAVSINGQIKHGGIKHEKDDRKQLNDASTYILGWNNKEKISNLKTTSEKLNKEIANLQIQVNNYDKDLETLKSKEDKLNNHIKFSSFENIDWKSLEVEVKALKDRLEDLNKTSDKLNKLREQKIKLEEKLNRIKDKISTTTKKQGGVETKINELRDKLNKANEEISSNNDFPKIGYLENCLNDIINEINAIISLDDFDKQERAIIKRFNYAKENFQKEFSNGKSKLIKEMGIFKNKYVLETAELGQEYQYLSDYNKFLLKLQNDDLPRFETRFKDLLHQHTIQGIASFNAKLKRDADEIQERIKSINSSLKEIQYNEGRYINIEVLQNIDKEISEFKNELRNCTSNSFNFSDDDYYNEQRFEAVKKIIDRLKGREGTFDADKKWRLKVTDVRNWFNFAASERYYSDDSQADYYNDSTGKSGGQKEKLAYTILAAGLAYQFGLRKIGEIKSRSFRFVVIDEAFGRGSEESARFGLELFKKLDLQLMVITPLQKIHVIEPYVDNVGFIAISDNKSKIRNLSIEQYKEEHNERA